ncbi:hypothetical protein K2Z83_13560 [Oscillochloris sp. ZM17-4]|uniref:phage tail tube protein n=1 Tax=Oscillochloris sp. ZM17-4 TaxID=2866714 RepID=UPI001C72AE4D|nr:hypothetical protein [Oscillochloris sp. ZM17-4]MBX0328704.1 hypothetical protein [Oscillochloris sp. ZM17-4]
MPQVPSDIIVTGARVFLAPVQTPAIDLPAPELAVDEAWPVGWIDIGFTLEPTKVTYKFDILEIFVEQSYSPVRRRRTKEEAMLETVIAEHSAGNLAIALAGIAATTAATSTVPGYEEFSVGGDPNLPLYMVGIEGSYNDESENFFPIRLFLWFATVADGGTLEYAKDKPAGIPLKLNALADTTKPRKYQLMKVQRIIDPATA